MVAAARSCRIQNVIYTRVYLQDVMPTSLELAGIQEPEHMEFKSLIPLIKGERHQSYASTYGTYETFQRMIVRGNDKLIF